MRNKCTGCDGLGYLKDVVSVGLTDPNDPYHLPHIERCDMCEVFRSDEEANNYIKEDNEKEKNKLG